MFARLAQDHGERIRTALSDSLASRSRCQPERFVAKFRMKIIAASNNTDSIAGKQNKEREEVAPTDAAPRRSFRFSSAAQLRRCFSPEMNYNVINHGTPRRVQQTRFDSIHRRRNRAAAKAARRKAFARSQENHKKKGKPIKSME